MAKEIYRVKFDKQKTPEGINCYRLYTLDMTGEVDGEYLTPQKITVRKGRVIVQFKEGIWHDFEFDSTVEVFRRLIISKADEQNNNRGDLQNPI